MVPRIGKLVGLATSIVLLVALVSPAAAASSAMVRVLHASPDAPAVDIYVNGSKVGAPLAGLAFGDLSAYVPLAAGTYDIKVCASADASICPIDLNGANAVTVAAGTNYTIAATNNLATIEAQILVDAPAPVADKAQVRVVHFSADTPAVDVLTQAGAHIGVDNLSYPNATGYLSLPGGSYDLKVCAHADNTVCPLDPGALTLANGTSYTVFAIGSLEGTTLTAAVGIDGAVMANTAMSRTGTSPLVLIGLLLVGLAVVSGARSVSRRTA